MEAVITFETSVSFHQTTESNVPEYSNFHNYLKALQNVPPFICTPFLPTTLPYHYNFINKFASLVETCPPLLSAAQWGESGSLVVL
jgi:hypothetical protein